MKKLINLWRVAAGRLSMLAASAVIGTVLLIAKAGTTSAVVKPQFRIPGPSVPGAIAAADRESVRTPATSSAVSTDGDIPAIEIPKVEPVVFAGDIRRLPVVPHRNVDRPELEEPNSPKRFSLEAQFPQPEEPNIALAPMPAPIKNFAGITRTDACTGGQCGSGTPPDTNGDVGPNHYIQAVNTAFAIFDKTTGARLASFTENSLFSGGPTHSLCDTDSFGDPIVLHDPLADRWILTNFAFQTDTFGNPVAPFYQCIAASRTSDPVSGGWNLYAIRTDTGAAGQPPANTLNDYPKFGVWNDCLYYAANGFLSPAGTFNGVEFGSFSKSDMYAGNALTGALGFLPSSANAFTMVPSNLSGPAGAVPPPGTPNYFVSESLTLFTFEVRKFTPGVNCGGGGILGAKTNVSQTSYSVPSTNIVPQPGTNITLDSLGDRIMQKVQYRKIGSDESLWVTHTFRSSNSGPTGSQWAQINVTGGTVSTTPVQQQKYNPADGIYRWTGSIAADKDGNVALGYSRSSGTTFPSIGYSGRLAGDTANMLPQTETVLVAGGGSQTHNCGGGPCHRWGDYASMSVDPDGCTFWFTSEYYVDPTAGSAGRWSTRIGSFKFPSCVPAGAATPTNFFTLQPCRVADTRNAVGPSGGPALTANTVRPFPVTGICGIPSTAKAVAINLAVVQPSNDGDLRIFPAGISAPLASVINFRAEIVRANNAVIQIGAGGQISVLCEMPSGATNFFFDVFGYFE